MITFTEATRARISVEDCTIHGIRTVELEVRNNLATVTCPCCRGEGEHWYGRGPYTDSYPCEPCKGKGHFQVIL